MNPISHDHILVLDDDIMMLETLSRFFRSSFAVHLASDVEQAWEMLYIHPVKLLLVDFNLQDRINGIEFCKSVKEEYPLKKIILITGNKERETVINALNSQSIDNFVTKPFDFEVLLAQIHENIESYDEEQQLVSDAVHRIREGKNLEQEELDVFGRELHIMAGLFFEGVEFTYDLKRNNVIAIMFYDHERILYKKVMDDTFSIQNEQIFFGFIEGLNSLSTELFSVQTSKIQSIELQNHITAVISMKQDYRGIVFVTDPIINKGDLLGEIDRFFDQLIHDFEDIDGQSFSSVDWRKKGDSLVERFLGRV